MNAKQLIVSAAVITFVVELSLSSAAETTKTGPERSAERMEGPPPFDPRGFGPGGPRNFPGFGGPAMSEDRQLLKQFDKDSNGWLNTEERQAARKSLEQENSGGGSPGRARPGGPRGPGGGFGRFPGSDSPPEAGAQLSPADVHNFGDAPLYASNALRTIFLEFESAEWEKELEAFYKSDVEVPARLTMDGKSYPEVGVRFRGNTSFMMVGSGRKRPLNISMDMAHEDQNLLGFRTLNLLNAHEDPSFLRAVLALQMARDYIPAPRANFVRLVINGENWGVYANVEQFNKDFLRDNFKTTKGVRWKVPGSPGGRGGLEYLGNDVAEYRRVYEIKSKDEPKAWARLMNLCKVLTETPAEELEKELSAVLDIDGALRFLAWDNVLASGDGFWTRASDYSMYEDTKGRFHLIPYDVNETFSSGAGPGRPGGRGPQSFGPGMFLAPQFIELGDEDGDEKVSETELQKLAETLFDDLDSDKTGAINQQRFVDGINEMLPPPPGAGQFGPPQGGRGRLGPGASVWAAIFASADEDKDTSLTRAELKGLFKRWFQEWNTSKTDALDEVAIRNGLTTSLPRPEFGSPGGMGGSDLQPGRRRGPAGLGGGPGRGGPNLDPLVSEKDATKPLLSKLLGVPEFRARYLGYVKHMAQEWLDWENLGPIARQYYALIGEDMKTDTKKLHSFEQFAAALEGAPPANSGNLKAFAEARRTYLLNHSEVKAAKAIPPK